MKLKLLIKYSNYLIKRKDGVFTMMRFDAQIKYSEENGLR